MIEITRAIVQSIKSNLEIIIVNNNIAKLHELQGQIYALNGYIEKLIIYINELEKKQ